MAFTVLYDACVLYPAPIRDVLMHLALTDLFHARWTNAIHEEWIGAVLENRPDLSRAQLERTRDLMNAHARDALIEARYGITVEHPDEFLTHALDLAPGLVVEALQRLRRSLKAPSVAVPNYLAKLEQQRLPSFVARLRDFQSAL